MLCHCIDIIVRNFDEYWYGSFVCDRQITKFKSPPIFLELPYVFCQRSHKLPGVHMVHIIHELWYVHSNGVAIDLLVTGQVISH